MYSRRPAASSGRAAGARAAAWSPRALAADRPIYTALADAIAADVASGRLRPGTRLPAQRALAARLGVDFTTVSRAYAEAARRGLVDGQVGRGTYVRGPQRETGIAPRLAPDGVIDLTLNLPPESVVAAAAEALPATLATIAADPGFAALLRYQQPAGREEHRAAAAAWLAPRYGAPISPDRVVLCGGAQHAISAALMALRATPEGTGARAPGVAAEELTYPGFRALAEGLGLAVVGLALDRDGVRPDAARAACGPDGVRLLYCTPNFQNPTASVMPAARRRALARVARECDLAIIEDDVYGPFAGRPTRSLSSYAPERGYYIASLSKVLSPGLRLAYLVAPDAAAAARVAAGVRATTWMASPLAAEIATRWIEDGAADRVVAAGRGEVAARARAAHELLARSGIVVHAPEGTMHAWLELPPPWTSAEFVVRARQAGVAIVPAESFAVGPRPAPAAVRVSLTAAPSLAVLRDALARLAGLVAAGPGGGGVAL